jgi:hypothetical protein
MHTKNKMVLIIVPKSANQCAALRCSVMIDESSSSLRFERRSVPSYNQSNGQRHDKSCRNTDLLTLFLVSFLAFLSCKQERRVRRQAFKTARSNINRPCCSSATPSRVAHTERIQQPLSRRSSQTSSLPIEYPCDGSALQSLE